MSERPLKTLRRSGGFQAEIRPGRYLKWLLSVNVGIGGCEPPQPDNKPLKTNRFRGIFAAPNLVRNFVRGSIVEAAKGKSQRKIGGVARRVMTQL
jgi:hypothetical protein